MKSKTPWWGWLISITVIVATIWLFVDGKSISDRCGGLTNTTDDFADCVERAAEWSERYP